MFSVIIVKDVAGEVVNLVPPEEDLIGGRGVRFRLALETDDYGLAIPAAELVQRRLAGC